MPAYLLFEYSQAIFLAPDMTSYTFLPELKAALTLSVRLLAVLGQLGVFCGEMIIRNALVAGLLVLCPIQFDDRLLEIDCFFKRHA